MCALLTLDTRFLLPGKILSHIEHTIWFSTQLGMLFNLVFFKASKFLKKSFQTAVYHAMEKTHSCMKVTFFVYICRKIHLPCRVLKLDFWGHLKHSGNAKLNPFS